VADASSSPDQTGPDKPARGWVRKDVVIPVVVAVASTLLIGALTPIGDGLRELFFPTKAYVSGAASVADQPAADAQVIVDEKAAGRTDETGGFEVVVGDGTHLIRFETPFAYTRTVRIRVVRGTTELNLGVIDLVPLAELGYWMTIQFAADQANPGLFGIQYDLTLWIEASPDVLEGIRSVSYLRPAPLSAELVKKKASVANNFCFRQKGVVFGDQLFNLGGSFTTAASTVDFGDGNLRITEPAPTVELRPPECEAVQEGTERIGDNVAGGGGVVGQGGGTINGGDTGTDPGDEGIQEEPPVVPDVTCLSFAHARETLLVVGLVIELADAVPALDACPSGQRIAQQDTPPGTPIEEGTALEPGDIVIVHFGIPPPSPTPTP
jgi:hypothetical protein